MQDYKKNFIALAIDQGVLKFGEFQLKSGRKSPYFFNAGLFNNGHALAEVGRFYARALMDSGVGFDMLFGPAYKGIALATVTAAALADHHDLNVPVAYNRKEAKDHGEGGEVIGAPLEGRVVIVDDVISAGTTVRESLELFSKFAVRPAAVLIALDRQERGQGEESAVQEVEQNLGTKVVNIVTLDDLIVYLQANDQSVELESVRRYRSEYGV